jgi:hypothetical protein
MAEILSISYGHRRLQLYRVVNSKLVSGLVNLINEQSMRLKKDGKEATSAFSQSVTDD